MEVGCDSEVRLESAGESELELRRAIAGFETGWGAGIPADEVRVRNVGTGTGFRVGGGDGLVDGDLRGVRRGGILERSKEIFLRRS